MTTPAIAPYVPTYASYTPYITSTEFLTANTGVDVSQLVPNGSEITQEAALADLLARASSEADMITQKALAATVDVVADEYRIMPDGRIWVPVEYTPLVAVTQVLVGSNPAATSPLSSLTGIVIKKKVAKIPLGGIGLQAPNSVPVPYPMRGRVYAVVTYVNGWAHSTLASAVEAGASSITPGVVAGFVPGLPFEIKDGSNTEPAVVDASYVYGSSVVPLAAPLQNAHGAGTTVSALPPWVKNAIINLAKSLTKGRGSKAIVLGSVKGNAVQAKTQTSDPGGDEDYAKAEKALMHLRRAR